MIIAIRKEPNGSLYMDKDIFNKTTTVIDEETGKEEIIKLYTPEQLSLPPYNYTAVEIEDVYSDCKTIDFNEDLTFNVEKYNTRKQKELNLKYKKEVERLIALRYDICDELAIRRQKDTKPTEYYEYFDYVEKCKLEAKDAINKKFEQESI